QTLEVVREARYAAAFTFQYSIRPGTPAATMPDQVPPEVVRDRYDRLVELVNQVAWEENQQLLGSRVQLLVAAGEGRTDAAAPRTRRRQPPRPLLGPRRHPSRRPRRRRGHLRRPAPPGRRRAGAGASSYPLRRRVGVAHRHADLSRRAGHADGRRAAAAGA